MLLAEMRQGGALEANYSHTRGAFAVAAFAPSLPAYSVI
jgi:hypothetical protein